MRPDLAASALLLVCPLTAQAPPGGVTLAATKLPVREVTVFKDGHAYVVRETAMPAGADGKVVLDELPVPVLGTFWPYALDGARLVSAMAGRTTVVGEVAAMDLRQIARANTGSDVVVVTGDKERIDGRLLGVPSRQETSAPSDGDLLLLQTAAGTRVLPLAMVRDLEVKGTFVGKVRGEQQQERLTLQVAGGGAAAKVGVMYVQRGLRWIPAYRIDIDGKGAAAVQFEATLVNDLVDLERATVNLVVGVPRFEFQGIVDPISLQAEAADVAAQMRQQQLLANALSNSLMTQRANFRDTRAAQGPESEPVVDGGDSNEDLFVWTVRDVTLKRGERLVLPIATFQVTYRDVYALDVPFAPPMEVRQGLQSERLVELAKQMSEPKARHLLRLRNADTAPLTTAPALVLASGRVLAQGRLFYTPKGGQTDLEINVAIDVRVDTEEHEVKRDAGPFRLGDHDFARVDVAGAIALQNHKSVAIDIEVSRRALGIADEVGQGGSRRQLDLLAAWSSGPRTVWWSWWNWPYWWFQHNGFAEFRWVVKLEPGASTKLDAGWHYFWR